ncbi:hypothetical protein B0O80DRAFT_447293 [Mortierella sp. GBAus27b]|nr:hypothetical protein B0O80DRAFT_447293 [Mortierella sp. GBAus27b]
MARLRQAYITINTDIQSKVIWRTSDLQSYNAQGWQTILEWFDVIVTTAEILVHILHHPWINIHVQTLSVVDDCLYHAKGEHCFQDLLEHFYDPYDQQEDLGKMKELSYSAGKQAPSDPVHFHILSRKDCDVLELRHRPAWSIDGWNRHSSCIGSSPKNDIVPTHDGGDTWRWRSMVLDDNGLDLSGWNFDISSGSKEFNQMTNEVELSYTLESSGAELTLWSAPSILYMYCASLPSMDIGNQQPLPDFEIVESGPPLRLDCWLTLPQGSAIREVSSSTFTTESLAMRYAAFIACKKLHMEGALDDTFLPRRIREVVFIEIYDDQPTSHPSEHGVAGRMDVGVKQDPVLPKKIFCQRYHGGAKTQIGNVFIKLLLAVDHFIRYPKHSEGRLTAYRVSAWIGFRNLGHATELESIGDACINGGVEDALQRTLPLLAKPLDGIRHWKDFGTTFQARPHIKRYPTNAPNLSEVETILGYVFNDKNLLLEALNAKSGPDNNFPSYQRLEYLGDAVVEMVAIVFWTREYPSVDGRTIKVLAAESVSNRALQTVCLGTGLWKYVWNNRLDPEIAKKVKKSLIMAERTWPDSMYWRKAALWKPLADVVESVLGAVFMDCGLELPVVADVYEKIHWGYVGSWIASSMGLSRSTKQ